MLSQQHSEILEHGVASWLLTAAGKGVKGSIGSIYIYVKGFCCFGSDSDWPSIGHGKRLNSTAENYPY